MGKSERERGKRGEREAAAELSRLFGVECQRSQQFCGKAGDADLIGLPGVFTEVKRRDRLNVPEAVLRAVEDAQNGDVPVVLHRRDREPWLVSLRLDDLPELVTKLFHVLMEKH